MYKRVVDFIHAVSPHRGTLFGIAFLALFFSLAPLQFAQANIFSDIFNAIKNLPITLPVLLAIAPLYAITAAIGLLSTLLNSLMMVFIHATMSIGVTPANQEIVNIGWTISRNLVNIALILILVFIGLATTLRLQSYQVQRTLPSLLIVALLVNFSGVFVGFVVDISNLVTNAFLPQPDLSSFGLLGSSLLGIGEQILDVIVAPGATVFTEAASLIIQVLIQFVYYVVATLIIFIVMLLFFVRVVLLWVLAILAPLAFASYILPATRRFWNQWLQQLIQWSIIGIPIAFFLFLTNRLLPVMNDVLTAPPPSGPSIGDAVRDAFTAPKIFPNLSDIIVSILGNFVILGMLMIGVLLSMQMAPAGAQGVINFGKKMPGRLAQTRFGSKLLSKTATGTQKVLAGTTPFMRRLEEQAGRVPIAGGILKRTTAAATRPAGWATRGANRLWGSRLTEYAASKRRISLPKNFDQMSEQELEAWAGSNNLGKEDLVWVKARSSAGLSAVKKPLKPTACTKGFQGLLFLPQNLQDRCMTQAIQQKSLLLGLRTA